MYYARDLWEGPVDTPMAGTFARFAVIPDHVFLFQSNYRTIANVTPIILVLGRLRQKDHFEFKTKSELYPEFQASLGYRIGLYLKTTNKTKSKTDK